MNTFNWLLKREYWEHRGGFFAAHCHCHANGRNDWTLEQSLPLRGNA